MSYSLAKIIRPTGPRVGLLLTAISLLIYAAHMPFLELMELKAFDLQMSARDDIPHRDEVVIAAIDEKSLDTLGRWPWPRTELARLVDTLSAQGAKAIAFDMVFSEPDENSGISAIKRLKERFGRHDTLLHAMEKEADNDSRFASAIKGSGRVVLGYFFHTSEDEVKGLDALRINRAFIAWSRIPLVRYKGNAQSFGLDNPLLDVPRGIGIEE
ncbi:MAG: CHASE2 domain-containing protein, partial [Deltaproteobacteria bacterium]|nr:CHASE2 domain-containing protein [Deltaproteobacteria bacterium]